jgi:hypothetical protein
LRFQFTFVEEGIDDVQLAGPSLLIKQPTLKQFLLGVGHRLAHPTVAQNLDTSSFSNF